MFPMAYQLYRNTTLGNSLQESLDELIQSQQITPQLALQVLLQFDKAINSALAQRVRNRVNFRGSLNTYRFCDNVWTFVLNDVEFREVTELIKVDKVKIVACDGKRPGIVTAAKNRFHQARNHPPVTFEVIQQSLDHCFRLPSSDPRTVDGPLCWQLQGLVQEIPAVLALKFLRVQIHAIKVTLQSEGQFQSNDGQQH
ncbi:hypothetical protein U0070_026927, partial [Myodes glareolus]